MTQYAMSGVPNITVKYKKDGAKNYKKMVIDSVTTYCFDTDYLSADFALVDDTFEEFKDALVRDEIHDFILTAEACRRNSDTGVDEEYVELNKVPFKYCHIHYSKTATPKDTIPCYRISFFNSKECCV